jgi:hypothetical protein
MAGSPRSNWPNIPCFESEPDALVGMIKADQIEPYGTLDKFVS